MLCPMAASNTTAHYYKHLETYYITLPPIYPRDWRLRPVRSDEERRDKRAPEDTPESEKEYYAGRKPFYPYGPDLPDLPEGAIEPLRDKERRTSWWLHCAGDDDRERLRPEHWKLEGEIEWTIQREDPRRQCVTCGGKLKGTDWLCRECKEWIGKGHKEEIAAKMGLTADRLCDAPGRMLTPKGWDAQRNDPEILNSGNLEYFETTVWPEEVKRRMYKAGGEEWRRKQHEHVLDAQSLDQMAEDAPGGEDGGALEPGQVGTDLTTGDDATGESLLEEEGLAALGAVLRQLTPKERQHVRMWAEGCTEQQIAEAQGYKRQATIAAHRAKIKAKLRALMLAEHDGNGRE